MTKKRDIIHHEIYHNKKNKMMREDLPDLLQR